jgi:hypothetical protein
VSELAVNGRCHCGKITYRAVVDSEAAWVCHCEDCQVMTGSAYRANIFSKPGTFELLSGSPKIYIKTADSGNRRSQAFCGECGTPIYSASPENTSVYGLRIGSLAERRQIKIVRQIWCDSALGWATDLTSVASVPRQ